MLPGYKTVERLQQGRGTDVLRCLEQASGKTVVIKYRTVGTYEAAKLRHEHDVLKLLEQRGVPNVVRALGLVEDQSTLALILEDIGARSMNRFRSLPTATVLDVAHAVVEALMGLHANQVIHKDIKPANIIYNPDTKQVRVIDLGIAATIGRELQALDSLNRLHGTLEYMSPEQTGRTSCMVDYRSDFYSLGVSLYEMLSSATPFIDQDIGRLIHAILSKLPPRPHNVPDVLADMILKLLEKEPQKRYQSGHGLLYDLQRCRASLREDGTILPFALATQDRSDRFEIPQKLYGRAIDQAEIRAAYARIASDHTREIIMLAGPSGIGKTALVHTVRGSMAKHDDFFVAGKYDQLRRHIPFTGLAQVFDALVRRLLSAPADVFQARQEKVRAALGGLGQAVVNVVPILQAVVGPQPPMPELPPQEAENALFAGLLRMFHALLANAPAVIFLDDLQWADGGSLKLLRQLGESAQLGGGLLLIGAYRDGEVDSAHPLRTVLAAWQKAGQKVHEQTIAPLGVADIAELVSDTTRALPDSATALAELLHQKTAGNPFFVHELLRDLWGKGLMSQSVENEWTWNLEAVRATRVADSVVDLMRNRLLTLSAEVQRYLSIAACLGSEFALAQMRVVHPEEHALAYVHQAMQMGLVLPTSNDHRYVTGEQDDAVYVFAHDRIQEAAYSLLSADEAQRVHVVIGTRLLEAFSQTKDVAQGAVFMIVNHLNRGQALLQSPERREELARLNLDAGVESRLAGAYDISRGYLETAVALFTNLGAAKHRLVLRRVSLALSDCLAMAGDLAGALALQENLLRESRGPVEAGIVQVPRVHLLQRMGKIDESIEAGVQALQALGHTVRPNILGMILAQVQFRMALRGRPIESIPTFDEMTDETALLKANLLSALGASFTMARNGLATAVASFDVITLGTRYGVHREICSPFAAAVLVMAAVRQDYKMAATYALVAQKLLERFPTAAEYGTAQLLVYCNDAYLRTTPSTLVNLADDLLRRSLELGEFVSPVSIRLFIIRTAWLSSLRICGDRYKKYEPAFKSSGDTVRVSTAVCVALSAAALEGDPASAMEGLDAELAKARAMHFTPGIALIRKTMVHLYLGEIDAGLDCAREAFAVNFFKSYLDHEITTGCFYVALLLIAKARRDGTSHPKQGTDSALWKFVFGKMQAVGKASPAGFLGATRIVEAELASLGNDDDQAAVLYEQGDDILSKAGLLAFRCIGLECAGRYFHGRGRANTALGFLLKARDQYHAWGAKGKVEAIESAFVDLFAGMDDADTSTMTERTRRSTLGHTTTSPGLDLDASILMKVGQALITERDIERLSRQILQSLVEVVGASRAVLIRTQGDKLVVAASSVLQDEGVPWTVVQYVQRSQDSLLLSSTDDMQRFGEDAYIARCAPKAVLCAPLVSSNELRGIIYLENQVNAAAFTTARLLSAKVLAAQAAAALENARLYNHLEGALSERTTALEQAHQRVLKLERAATESRMAGGFAHEVRNALGGPSYVLQAVLRGDTGLGKPSELLEETLMMVQEGVERGLKLTDRISYFAGIAQSEAPVVGLPLAALVDNILHEFEGTLGSVSCQVEVEPQIAVAMPRDHVETILRTLVANARDALAEVASGNERRLILRGVVKADDSVELGVEDTGVGMTPATQARVFEPFFTTKGSEGLGLALGVSKKIAEMYGGSLRFASEPQKGSSFVVSLPLGRPDKTGLQE